MNDVMKKSKTFKFTTRIEIDVNVIGREFDGGGIAILGAFIPLDLLTALRVGQYAMAKIGKTPEIKHVDTDIKAYLKEDGTLANLAEEALHRDEKTRF